ncbi:unnamed protein product [Gulo gulo]|uniref:Uncharacterized protein n=1 Tax=Gulo gulo TaxID=48420 RepID=A0A9X9Q6Z7_GULGU|nr:unnamed protein product [Gulo gulo]
MLNLSEACLQRPRPMSHSEASSVM